MQHSYKYENVNCKYLNHCDIEFDVVQQNVRNTIQQDHPTQLLSGIGTFTQCRLCDVQFVFILEMQL